jgi:hypothetical protein
LPAPSGSSATGGARIAIPAVGLSIQLPDGWIGLDSTVPPNLLVSTGTRFPDAAPDLNKLRTNDVAFVGLDASSSGATTPRATIAVTGDPIPVASLLDTLAKQTADQLASTEAITDVQHMTTTLPAGPAAELRYTLMPKDGSPPVAVDSYFISTKDHTFLLTFTVPSSTADQWRAPTRTMAESLAAG